jgi:sec-independent protein translocase protein TatA
VGFGGISIWQLLIVLVIVILLFGTKKLRSLGGDLGNAIKNFRSAVKDADSATDPDNDDKNKLTQETLDIKDNKTSTVPGSATPFNADVVTKEAQKHNG